MKWSNRKPFLVAMGFIAALSLTSNIASASNTDQYKGKTVAYVPTSLGYDLTDGWNAMVGQPLKELGINWEVRDPNWSTDAGAQAITSLISQKPDVMLVQNPDVQSYSRLLGRAEKAGIRVVQVNMRSSQDTSAYVGADWVGIGKAMAEEIVKRCGAGSDTSGKVSIVQGVLTSASSVLQMQGVDEVLSQNSDIKVVSNQAADWDASKARDITKTVLKQNSDLCGVIGFWDGQDTGTAAAIHSEGLGDQVTLVSNGGAASTGCKNVRNGNFSVYVTYNVKTESEDLVDVVKTLLDSGEKPAEMITKYAPVDRITLENIKDDSCWSIE